MDNNVCEKDTEFWILLAYALSLLWFEAYSCYIYKPITRFFNQFWRIYKVVMILLLIASIIIRDFRTTFVDGDVTNPEDHPIKNLTYQFEVAIFSNFTVMAVVRVFGFMRLSRHIGPTIINLSQVVGDVLHMLVIWLWVNVSWTLGFMYMKYNRVEAHSSQGDPPHFVSEFTSMVHNISWNLLVYDKRIIDFPDLSTNEKMDWIKASDSLMFFCYQSFRAVVILNLLIAIMNATIQRYHDKSYLNWTVATSYLCTEYFDEISAFPAPYSFLHIIYIAIRKCKQSRSCKAPQKRKESFELFCESDAAKRRKDYAALMKTLIQRINEEKTNYSD